MVVGFVVVVVFFVCFLFLHLLPLRLASVTKFWLFSQNVVSSYNSPSLRPWQAILKHELQSRLKHVCYARNCTRGRYWMSCVSVVVELLPGHSYIVTENLLSPSVLFQCLLIFLFLLLLVKLNQNFVNICDPRGLKFHWEGIICKTRVMCKFNLKKNCEMHIDERTLWVLLTL